MADTFKETSPNGSNSAPCDGRATFQGYRSPDKPGASANAKQNINLLMLCIHRYPANLPLSVESQGVLHTGFFCVVAR